MFQNIRIRALSKRESHGSIRSIYQSDGEMLKITYVCNECGDPYTLRRTDMGRRLIDNNTLDEPQLCKAFNKLCHEKMQYPFYTQKFMELSCMGMRCGFCRREEAEKQKDPFDPTTWTCSDCAGTD